MVVYPEEMASARRNVDCAIVGRGLFYLVISFYLLFCRFCTAELRVDEFPVDELCGRSLYKRRRPPR
jgi:hypothetical protein